jgi:carboxymethylenebutenolidase
LPSLPAAGPATAAQIAESDPRIHAARIAISTGWGKLDCYLARPEETEAAPGVIVAHDKLGLTPHFEDVARRLAVEGFIVLAPDYASRFGGTPSEAGPALEVVGMEHPPFMIADTRIGFDWLRSAGKGGIKIGALGFGFGATGINLSLARIPDLRAAVAFYGHPPPPADVASIKASLLLNFAGKDQFIDPEIPEFIEALKKAGVSYEMFRYENTERGFDDDSAPAHYSKEAANVAWSRTIKFLRKALK